ncbi:glycoside hydrolase family 2 protein [Pyxidicoccus caerfyrddinensis]|uniref:glycoside hydrolase family 2 protein n=1 Tax=Pyxidicoccus caerfyrddinensis TaxID=2709663 RepID=UPI001967E1FD|nr:glycoside hydrolase family 2 protein [Pyxidicoccus caerfyrddinensis]
MGRIRNVSSHRVTPLETGWQAVAVEPGAVDHPSRLAERALAWLPALVPGTAASLLRAAGPFDLDRPPPLDTRDWWYRTDVSLPPAEGGAVFLRFDGLATLAEVWLDDEPVLRSDNMFLAHSVDVTRWAGGTRRLALRFRSLAAALQERRARPRWKTRLVDAPHLRWFRTTLLGHIPGWCPPVPPVGPWRPVSVEHHVGLSVEQADLRSSVVGEGGSVTVDLRVRAWSPVRGATVRVGEGSAPLVCEAAGEGVWRLHGEARLDSVERWWPHTHGEPRLYPVQVDVTLEGGASVSLDAGRVGFRTVELSTADGGFALSINGVPVFCRGACWTPLDVVSLGGTEKDYAEALDLARSAGMNILRVGGTMVYEDDRFYEACDARGILVWQDFMFANMDYPAEDAAFSANVRREAEQFLSRVQGSPSLTVLCGNSEAEQQAAMMGMAPAMWTGPLFEKVLPEAGTALRPDVPYWRSSPSGGAMPFHTRTGVTHYYGVGAYLRPMEDARRAGVRFASECLAFANVPEDATIERMLADGEAPAHHPKWKARVPRDPAAGWDFEDVRDHYVGVLFGVEPARLRYSDMARYLALGRVTSGEVMAATLAEFRRPGSTCHGALVWFFRDLWPGAGWGVVDSTGLPKAAYYGVKRASGSVLLSLSDEGLDGLDLNVTNDSGTALDAELEVAFYRDGEVVVARGRAPAIVPARGSVRLSAEAMAGHFMDSTYAYRFGPPGHELAVASLFERGSGRLLQRAFHFAHAAMAARRGDVGLEAVAFPGADGSHTVRLRAKRFVQAASFETPGHVPEDNYFHLAPGDERTVVLRPRPSARAFRGFVHALNAATPVRIELAPAEAASPREGSQS